MVHRAMEDTFGFESLSVNVGCSFEALPQQSVPNAQKHASLVIVLYVQVATSL